MPHRRPRTRIPNTRPKPSRSAPRADDEQAAKGVRLQKVLAEAGVASRRQCEELIQSGRVEIDRETVTELGVRVDPARQEIRLDGEVLKRHRHVYYAVNKPEGVVSTNRDPAGRPRVIDLVPASSQRLFAVGRLDLHSEGLILLTNDGDLAHRLTHPRFGVEKTYRVSVAGEPEDEVLDRLRRGVWLAEGRVRARAVTVRGRHKGSSVLEIVLDEGRNREIRRMLARVGHKLLRLQRIAVGPVRLGQLPPGTWRRLSVQEVQALRAVAHGKKPPKGRKPRKHPKSRRS